MSPSVFHLSCRKSGGKWWHEKFSGDLWTLVRVCNKPQIPISFPYSSLEFFPAQLTDSTHWEVPAGKCSSRVPQLHTLLPWIRMIRRVNRSQGFGLRPFQIHNLHGTSSRAEKKLRSQLEKIAEGLASHFLCSIAL